jgi:hypothetical protein
MLPPSATPPEVAVKAREFAALVVVTVPTDRTGVAEVVTPEAESWRLVTPLVVPAVMG